MEIKHHMSSFINTITKPFNNFFVMLGFSVSVFILSTVVITIVGLYLFPIYPHGPCNCTDGEELFYVFVAGGISVFTTILATLMLVISIKVLRRLAVK